MYPANGMGRIPETYFLNTSGTLEAQPGELRIASQFPRLAVDPGISPETQFRIAARGMAVRESYDERKACFDILRKVYGLTSSVL